MTVKFIKHNTIILCNVARAMKANREKYFCIAVCLLSVEKKFELLIYLKLIFIKIYQIFIVFAFQINLNSKVS